MNFFLSEGQHAKHPNNNNIFKPTKIKHGISINNPSDIYLNMQVHIKLTEDNHYHLLKGMHAQQAEMQEIGEGAMKKIYTKIPIDQMAPQTHAYRIQNENNSKSRFITTIKSRHRQKLDDNSC